MTQAGRWAKRRGGGIPKRNKQKATRKREGPEISKKKGVGGGPGGIKGFEGGKKGSVIANSLGRGGLGQGSHLRLCV